MKRTLIKATIASLIVGLLSGFAVLSALALSVDQSRTMQQRQFRSQQTHYYRFTINYNDPNISGTNGGQKFGMLAKGTYISSIMCDVTAAFDADGDDLLSIGTTLGGAQILATTGANASIDLTTLGFQSATTAAGRGLAVTASADVTLYAKYTYTSTAPTAGSATCILTFVPNNDM